MNTQINTHGIKPEAGGRVIRLFYLVGWIMKNPEDFIDYRKRLRSCENNDKFAMIIHKLDRMMNLLNKLIEQKKPKGKYNEIWNLQGPSW